MRDSVIGICGIVYWQIKVAVTGWAENTNDGQTAIKWG